MQYFNGLILDKLTTEGLKGFFEMCFGIFLQREEANYCI